MKHSELKKVIQEALKDQYIPELSVLSGIIADHCIDWTKAREKSTGKQRPKTITDLEQSEMKAKFILDPKGGIASVPVGAYDSKKDQST